jgi:hypothetical protein
LVRASPIDTLSERLGLNWANLAEARRKTDELRDRLSVFGKLSAEDTSIVVVGSIGRGEVTDSSDVDWTLLIDGPADPHHAKLVSEIRRGFEDLGLQKPGQTETFAVMASSHELVHHIAGTHDTNQNLTRRILLLFESAAITGPLVRSRVIRNVMDRYVTHDVIAPRPEPPDRVIPHFLLNDVVRYWRTMASDYASKMWERQNTGWGLRNVKLRFSRKLIFVAGLLACFSFELDPPDDAESIRADREGLPLKLTTHVLQRLELSPLEALASFLLKNGNDSAARQVFAAYDQFLGILLDVEKRDELKCLQIENALASPVWHEARAASHEFRKGLESLFLEKPGTLKDLTLRFGLF